MITEELHKREKIIKILKPSPFSYLGGYIFGFVFTGIIIPIIVELIRRGNTYYVTNERVIHNFTFLSKKVSSCYYDKIQDLHITQGLFERLFGIGTIHVNTAGSHFVEIKFKGIQEPSSIKRMIEERMRRGKK